MRIQIEQHEHRGLALRTMLALLRRYIGMLPGPISFMTFDARQIPKGLTNHMMRSVAARGSFSKGELELFAAFVSKLNACNF